MKKMKSNITKMFLHFKNMIMRKKRTRKKENTFSFNNSENNIPNRKEIIKKQIL